jgi:hypothetical protein
MNSSIQVFKYSSIQVFKYSSIQVFKYSSIQYQNQSCYYVKVVITVKHIAYIGKCGLLFI